MSGDIPQLNDIIDNYVSKRAPMAYPAGVEDWDKPYLRYSPNPSNSPNLIVVNPIFDNDQNVIMPGYYELILSYERDFLLLTQSEKLIAVIPVFKIEEDKTQILPQQPQDKKSLVASEKEKKKKEKLNKKRVKKGEEPLTDEIYNEASIEYDKDGDYYLIKYERGAIRAWGAIK